MCCKIKNSLHKVRLAEAHQSGDKPVWVFNEWPVNEHSEPSCQDVPIAFFLISWIQNFKMQSFLFDLAILSMAPVLRSSQSSSLANLPFLKSLSLAESNEF